jgi:hypothetical protein
MRRQKANCLTRLASSERQHPSSKKTQRDSKGPAFLGEIEGKEPLENTRFFMILPQ